MKSKTENKSVSPKTSTAKPTPEKRNNITIPLPQQITTTHLLVTLLIISSFLLGYLTSRLQYLESSTNQTQTTANAAAPAAETPTEDTTPKEVSLDDDPVLGDANAPVTMVEFSDYECPFCKRHFTDTYPQLKEEYIDTGKVKLVFRDLPLSFHDPLATKEAIAANCAREQGDDNTYFQFHDAVFTKTTSNGTGLTDEALFGIAGELGLDAAALQSCVEAEKYKEEVRKDLADAGAVGAASTPTFYIGKSTDTGTITGTPIIGAYPYDTFKTLIEEKLAE